MLRRQGNCKGESSFASSGTPRRLERPDLRMRPQAPAERACREYQRTLCAPPSTETMIWLHSFFVWGRTKRFSRIQRTDARSTRTRPWPSPDETSFRAWPRLARRRPASEGFFFHLRRGRESPGLWILEPARASDTVTSRNTIVRARGRLRPWDARRAFFVRNAEERRARERLPPRVEVRATTASIPCWREPG